MPDRVAGIYDFDAIRKYRDELRQNTPPPGGRRCPKLDTPGAICIGACSDYAECGLTASTGDDPFGS
jgi:hypothetical protein